MMKRIFVHGLIASLMLLLAAPACAGRFGAQHRLSRNQSRVVSKRAQKLFKPKLVIRENNAGKVTAMTLGAGEKYLGVAMEDDNIRVWDLEVGRQVRMIPSGDAVAVLRFDEYGRMVCFATAKEAVAVDMVTGEPVVRTSTPGDVFDVWLHDGKMYVLHEEGVNSYPLKGGQEASLEFDKDIVGGRSDGNGRFCTVDKRGVVARYDVQSKRPVILSKSTVRPGMVAFDATAAHVAVVRGSEAVIVETTAMKEVGRIKVARGLDALVCHASGHLFAVDGDELIRYGWKADSPLTVLEDHDELSHPVVDASGDFLLGATSSGMVELINVSSRTVQVRLVMTGTGWMAVNDRGAFDGAPGAVNDVHWEDKDVSVPVAAFTSSHYTPGVLTRGFAVVGKEVEDIPEGVQMPPAVEARLVRTSGGKAVVDVTVESRGDTPVKDVFAFRNGKRVLDVPKRTDEDDDEFTDRYTIDLSKGRNVLDFVAANSDGLESPVARVIAENGKPAAKTTIHVVSVGIDRYLTQRMNLNFAVADSSGLAGFWERTATKSERPAVSKRYNEDATRPNIINTLRFLQAMPREDMAFIFLAGHGVVLEKEWYFIPHDFDLDKGEEELKRVGISATDLQQLMESMGPDRVFLGIDACYSGASMDSLANFKGLKTLRLLSRDVGVTILSGASKDQFAVEISQLGHGVFSYTLLEGLTGKADVQPANGAISTTEIMRFVEEQVPFLSQEYANYPQYPTSHSRGKEFILLRDAR